MISRTFRTAGAGAVTVVALQDGEGHFFQPRAEAFPAATAEHWRRADALDPGAVRDGEWWLRFRCYALRFEDGRVILVDTGIGPADAPANGWAPVPGRLPAELAAAGIDPDEVATVVLTHLHTDHVGWAVDSGVGQPYFRNARYLLQQAEIEAIERLGTGLAGWLLQPLRATGQLSGVDGDAPLAAGLRIVATPGHTPGHQSVLLDADGGPLLITGDLLASAVQLVDPGLPYAYETDPQLARRSRVRLLANLAGRDGATLATPHLGEPFVAGAARARPRRRRRGPARAGTRRFAPGRAAGERVRLGRRRSAERWAEGAGRDQDRRGRPGAGRRGRPAHFQRRRRPSSSCP